MATSKEYLQFILEQLSDLDGVSYRAVEHFYCVINKNTDMNFVMRLAI